MSEVKKMKAWQRVIAKAIIVLFGAQVFDYLEDVASRSKFSSMQRLVFSVRKFAAAVSPDIWTSLSEAESKKELEEIFNKNDTDIALAAYSLGVEHILSKLDEDLLLIPFIEKVIQLGHKVMVIYTDDDENNRGQINELIKEESKKILFATLEEVQYYAANSERVDKETKEKIDFSFEITKSLLRETV